MKNIVIVAVLLVIVGAGSFFVGSKFFPNLFGASAATNGRNGRGGQFAQRFGANSRPVSGQIISADASSFTVKLRDGSSKIVLLSDSSQINKAVSATKDDIKTGENVLVIGQTNSDGSVTAQSIQLGTVFTGSSNQ